MSKPDWPQPPCILTPGAIQRIRENIEHYERDPERYERQEREERERREQEEWAMREEERRSYQKDDLPF